MIKKQWLVFFFSIAILIGFGLPQTVIAAPISPHTQNNVDDSTDDVDNPQSFNQDQPNNSDDNLSLPDDDGDQD